ncbi:uncharacterized protein LOC122653932 [Telopea speciosissima]|uniref:uncharacterized protein LOC122653932 n=1 Tax=Telopea speciosissima TaxID=54955 RepID=UPI001CC339D4|nr:uncharacterized protein LOC122653932 [Telopea speciosissima]
MEKSRKQRGFMRGGKLVMSLFKAAKPAISIVQFSSKVVKPTPSSASLGFRVDQDLSIPPAPKQKVSFSKRNIATVRESFNGRINSLNGGEGDENVDSKAATYISCVQERFKNEQDMMDWRI